MIKGSESAWRCYIAIIEDGSTKVTMPSWRLWLPDFQTIELDYAQAKEQLDIHAAASGESSKKPEKFPRPEIILDSSSEDWSEFKVTWGQWWQKCVLFHFTI